MKILSLGAGMQSTALALMALEKLLFGADYPLVPIYDAIIFVDLHCEPAWVYRQVQFVKELCDKHGIPFYIVDTYLLEDQAYRIQTGKYIKMPLWTMRDGKKAKLRRTCTIDFKILELQKYVKRELLGYRPYERLRPEDVGAHEMHIGFSAEEMSRIFESKNPMFINKYPLAAMGLVRCVT